MNFNEYQDFCKSTALYPRRGLNVEYPTLGLCGEAGEAANKVKKIYRDDGGRITDESRMSISEELGDTLWYLAMVADEINLSLETIALRNILKLKDRQNRGVIKGSGDNR